MSIFKNLFARSPFSPLQQHMEKVADCVSKLEELFEAYRKKDYKKIKKIAEEISALEHAADLTKNEIRNNLPKGLFLAVNRGDLLEILSLQDGLADRAEDIGVMMTMKKLEPLEGMEDLLKQFLDKNLEAVRSTQDVIREMDE
ncbi:MAG: TIGR00153 family protein, partial [Calditrichaeota bacterium]|nr:TIGR00153 family protein [Calditrichota bacterium]